MKLPDNLYDVLKWISLVFLPAATTLYGVIGATLHIPYTQETLTILVAVDTFMGTLLGISNQIYKKSSEDEEDE